MGRTLHLRKLTGTSWNDISRDVVKSWIDPTAILPANPINPRTGKPYNYPAPKVGRFNLENVFQLSNIFFVQIGGEFGCREGLTRTAQGANEANLKNKNSILVVKENMGLPVDTSVDEFSDHWREFVREVLTCGNMNPELADLFALVSTRGKQACFPVTKRQIELGDSTFASALVQIIRQSNVLIKKKNSFRDYSEVIIEAIRDLEDVYKKNDEIKVSNDRRRYSVDSSPYKQQVKMKYYGVNTNVILWHILNYVGILSKVKLENPESRPNGPSTFISRYNHRVASVITKSNNEQAEKLLELLGGPESYISTKYTTGIRTALLDRASKLK